jgi:hypothetical protein
MHAHVDPHFPTTFPPPLSVMFVGHPFTFRILTQEMEWHSMNARALWHASRVRATFDLSGWVKSQAIPRAPNAKT